MVKLIRGEPVESEEKAMYLRHNRRLIATQHIPAGGVLTYGDNYGAYRSLADDTRGLSPLLWMSVEGKHARIDIERGKPIGLGDFE
jgi:sialic acid synthase SpsE